MCIELIGQVAQSVEQRTENPRVGGSIPSLTIFSCPHLPIINNNGLNDKRIADIFSGGNKKGKVPELLPEAPQYDLSQLLLALYR
jgi:hypothetical protein